MAVERAAAPQTRWTLQTVLVVGALPTATPCARLHARHVLSDWGLRDQADNVELIVSELVTNAAQASLTPDGRPLYFGDGGLDTVYLRLSSDLAWTLVEVWDQHLGTPDLTLPDVDDESGRGLMIVAALSERWGWDMTHHGSGKMVWALVGR
jgi:anti-sigma regulatory factor (Ser/Thr protein kinase)